MKQHHFNICWQYFNIETSGKFFGGGSVATEIKVKYSSDFLVAKKGPLLLQRALSYFRPSKYSRNPFGC